MTITEQAPPIRSNRVVEFIRRHPLTSYLLIFNLFGQPFAFAPVIARRVCGVELNVDLILMIPAILFMGGAALLVTRIAKGPDALRALVGSAWEETAWQGLVQNTFQDRYGPWKAVLLTTPWFLLEHAFFAAEGTWSDALVWVVAFLVIAIPVRALMGWIYNRTGSIFLVGLTHASSNAVGASLMVALFGSWGSTGLAYVVPGILVLILTKGRLGLPSRPR